jgi:hypothetical protein
VLFVNFGEFTMKISRSILRKMIQTALNEVSPAWREDPSRRFDVEATPVDHGHYGALNPNKRNSQEVEASVNLEAEEEFKQYAINEFDRIFKTDFYKNKLADAGGQFDFVADDTITRALSGDIMHGLLHEMLERYIFEVFKEKRMNQPEYDLWTNIMETIVYYLQNGVGGTNPKPFGRWITQRMSETTELPETVDGDKLYDMFTKIFTTGTADRPGHNQIEEIPEKLRTPFLRNIQKALKKKGSVKPQEAFTQAVTFLINDIHKGGNAKTFLYDVDGNDISDQVMTFYNVLKRKVDQLKKKYPSTKNESTMYALRRAIRECGMDMDDMTVGHDLSWEEHEGDMSSEERPFDAPDEERPGYMLLGNLKKLAVKSSELADLATSMDSPEPWIESKVNSASEHIDAVYDYIMYSVLDQDFDAEEHEDMMHECGEMMGDMMMEPMMPQGRHMGDGGSAEMVRGQLFLIAKRSQSLTDRLTDDDTLPEWLQSKIAMAYQTIATVSDYLEYKMHRAGDVDTMQESFMSTVKGAFTGANKAVSSILKVIDSDYELKNDVYDDFLVKRNKPEAAVRAHITTFRKKFDKIFRDAGVTQDNRSEVESLLVPKLVQMMKEMDKVRVSRTY